MSSLVQTRPCGVLDAQGRVIPNSYGYLAFRGDYGGSGNNIIYKGFARAGSAEGSLVWQISKQTYDASNNLLSITWPQISGIASTEFEFSWTGRAGYTYS